MTHVVVFSYFEEIGQPSKYVLCPLLLMQCQRRASRSILGFPIGRHVLTSGSSFYGPLSKKIGANNGEVGRKF